MIANIVSEVLGLLMARNTLEEKVLKCQQVESYRLQIPMDLVQLEALRCTGTEALIRYNSDAFHYMMCENSPCFKCPSDIKFHLNSNYIYFSEKEFEVDIAYKGFMLDDEGLPMIPDNESLKMAIELYCAVRLGRREYLKDKLSKDKLDHLRQEYAFYAGQAKNVAEMPSVDLMESMMNARVRLIPKINRHSNGFKNLGDREQRILHNLRK